MIAIGTRTRQNLLQIEPAQGTITRFQNPDKGMTKRSPSLSAVTASTSGSSFSSTGNFEGNGNFPHFAIDDVIRVEGTVLNNGFFTVTGIDSQNTLAGQFQSFLVVSPPPKNETLPASYTIRTA